MVGPHRKTARLFVHNDTARAVRWNSDRRGTVLCVRGAHLVIVEPVLFRFASGFAMLVASSRLAQRTGQKLVMR
jgi:hypothetical protein